MRFYKIVFALLVFAFLLAGCQGKSNRFFEKKIEGVNGLASYSYDDDGKVVRVLKDAYNADDFMVFLYKDTVSVGESVVCLVHVVYANHEIEFTHPLPQIISGSESNFGLKEYSYTPTKLGVDEIRGVIKYDSIVAPFEYQFVVMPGK